MKDEEDGQIICGGDTAYATCKRSTIQQGQWTVLPSARGGSAHLVVPCAQTIGIRNIAIDGAAERKKLCRSLSTEEFIDFMTWKDVAAEITRATTYVDL
jgi:alcohol dehydrogenase, propanol-preferring